jgi:8-oxo-dGTP diphosphatase
MNQPLSRRVTVSVAILKGDHVIMVREGKGRKRGYWNLPSGRPHPSESLVLAAQREAREETGLSIDIIGLIGIYTYVSPTGRSMVRFVFYAEPRTGELRRDHDEIDEIMEVKWSRPADVLRMEQALWAKITMRQIMQDIQSGKRYPLDLIKTM